MYEKTVTANGGPSKWNANLVFVPKPGQVHPRLTFYYHFIYEDILASNIKAASTIHDLLTILSHQCLLSADIKHGYWAVNVHLDDWYYLAFHMPGIDQVQLNFMPQRARTSFFTFSELIIIVFGSILSPQPEPSLLHGRTAKDTASLMFYMDNIFGAFRTY